MFWLLQAILPAKPFLIIHMSNGTACSQMSKNFWHDIEPGIDIPEIINVIVEIPKGSMNKYEYDKKGCVLQT